MLRSLRFVFIGRGLSLPSGVPIPDVIQKALDSAQPRRSTSNRDSVHRKQHWWLPYVVLEFDKNEILIEALGGDLSKPEWNHRADLCVSSSSAHCVSARRHLLRVGIGRSGPYVTHLLVSFRSAGVRP